MWLAFDLVFFFALQGGLALTVDSSENHDRGPLDKYEASVDFDSHAEFFDQLQVWLSDMQANGDLVGNELSGLPSLAFAASMMGRESDVLAKVNKSTPQLNGVSSFAPLMLKFQQGINKTHDATQERLNTLPKGVHYQCTKKKNARKAFRIMKHKFQRALSWHRRCRRDQMTTQTSVHDCEKLGRALTSDQESLCNSQVLQKVADHTCDPAQGEKYDSWIDTQLSYHAKQLRDFDHANRKCSTITSKVRKHTCRRSQAMLRRKRVTCERALMTLEGTACSYATTDISCKLYDQCFKLNRDEFEKSVIAAKKEEVTLKLQWRATSRFSCLFDAIDASGAVVSDKFNKCIGHGVYSADHLNYTYPKFPFKKECIAPNVRPGTLQYQQILYAGVPRGMKFRSPTKCAMPRNRLKNNLLVMEVLNSGCSRILKCHGFGSCTVIMGCEGAYSGASDIAVRRDGSFFMAEAAQHRVSICSHGGTTCRSISNFTEPVAVYSEYGARYVVVDKAGNRIDECGVSRVALHELRRGGENVTAGNTTTVNGIDNTTVNHSMNHTSCNYTPTNGTTMSKATPNHGFNNLTDRNGNAICRTIVRGVGGTCPSQMSSPSSFTRDSADGDYIVTSMSNHRIQKCSKRTPGACVTIIGSDTCQAGRKTQELSSPSKVVVDRDGWYLVVDTGNHRIQRCKSVAGPWASISHSKLKLFARHGGRRHRRLSTRLRRRFARAKLRTKTLLKRYRFWKNRCRCRNSRASFMQMTFWRRRRHRRSRRRRSRRRRRRRSRRRRRTPSQRARELRLAAARVARQKRLRREAEARRKAKLYRLRIARQRQLRLRLAKAKARRQILSRLRAQIAHQRNYGNSISKLIRGLRRKCRRCQWRCNRRYRRRGSRRRSDCHARAGRVRQILTARMVPSRCRGRIRSYRRTHNLLVSRIKLARRLCRHRYASSLLALSNLRRSNRPRRRRPRRARRNRRSKYRRPRRFRSRFRRYRRPRRARRIRRRRYRKRRRIRRRRYRKRRRIRRRRFIRRRIRRTRRSHRFAPRRRRSINRHRSKRIRRFVRHRIRHARSNYRRHARRRPITCNSAPWRRAITSKRSILSNLRRHCQNVRARSLHIQRLRIRHRELLRRRRLARARARRARMLRIRRASRARILRMRARRRRRSARVRRENKRYHRHAKSWRLARNRAARSRRLAIARRTRRIRLKVQRMRRYQVAIRRVNHQLRVYLSRLRRSSGRRARILKNRNQRLRIRLHNLLVRLRTRMNRLRSVRIRARRRLAQGNRNWWRNYNKHMRKYQRQMRIYLQRYRRSARGSRSWVRNLRNYRRYHRYRRNKVWQGRYRQQMQRIRLSYRNWKRKVRARGRALLRHGFYTMRYSGQLIRAHFKNLRLRMRRMLRQRRRAIRRLRAKRARVAARIRRDAARRAMQFRNARALRRARRIAIARRRRRLRARARARRLARRRARRRARARARAARRRRILRRLLRKRRARIRLMRQRRSRQLARIRRRKGKALRKKLGRWKIRVRRAARATARALARRRKKTKRTLRRRAIRRLKRLRHIRRAIFRARKLEYNLKNRLGHSTNPEECRKVRERIERVQARMIKLGASKMRTANRILKVLPETSSLLSGKSICTQFIGTGKKGSGAKQLDSPTDLIVDIDGSYLVADAGNTRIQRCFRTRRRRRKSKIHCILLIDNTNLDGKVISLGVAGGLN